MKWHDGQPFTSKDVKFTFDVVREAKDAPAKLRLNPRKEWYGNVEAIETPDASTVVFRLKRPAALAAHHARLRVFARPARPRAARRAPRQVHRHGPVQVQGVEARRVRRAGEEPRLLRQGPALPRRHPATSSSSSAGRAWRRCRPARSTWPIPATRRSTSPSSSRAPCRRWSSPRRRRTSARTSCSNDQAAPLDNVKVRRALSLAIDRKAYVQAVHQGSAIVGAAMSPKPWGVWGLLDKDLAQLAGLRQGRGGQGARQEAPRRGGLRTVEPAQDGDGDARHRHLHRLRRLRRQRVQEDRRGGDAQADRHRPVAPDGHPPRVPDRRQPDGPRHRRSRRQLLRELRLRLAAQLRRVLQRAGHGPDRQAVAGDRSAEARWRSSGTSRRSSRRTRPGRSWAGASIASRTCRR